MERKISYLAIAIGLGLGLLNNSSFSMKSAHEKRMRANFLLRQDVAKMSATDYLQWETELYSLIKDFPNLQGNYQAMIKTANTATLKKFDAVYKDLIQAIAKVGSTSGGDLEKSAEIQTLMKDISAISKIKSLQSQLATALEGLIDKTTIQIAEAGNKVPDKLLYTASALDLAAGDLYKFSKIEGLKDKMLELADALIESENTDVANLIKTTFEQSASKTTPESAQDAKINAQLIKKAQAFNDLLQEMPSVRFIQGKTPDTRSRLAILSSQNEDDWKSGPFTVQATTYLDEIAKHLEKTINDLKNGPYGEYLIRMGENFPGRDILGEAFVTTPQKFTASPMIYRILDSYATNWNQDLKLERRQLIKEFAHNVARVIRALDEIDQFLGFAKPTARNTDVSDTLDLAKNVSQLPLPSGANPPPPAQGTEADQAVQNVIDYLDQPRMNILTGNPTNMRLQTVTDVLTNLRIALNKATTDIRNTKGNAVSPMLKDPLLTNTGMIIHNEDFGTFFGDVFQAWDTITDNQEKNNLKALANAFLSMQESLSTLYGAIGGPDLDLDQQLADIKGQAELVRDA